MHKSTKKSYATIGIDNTVLAKLRTLKSKTGMSVKGMVTIGMKGIMGLPLNDYEQAVYNVLERK